MHSTAGTRTRAAVQQQRHTYSCVSPSSTPPGSSPPAQDTSHTAASMATTSYCSTRGGAKGVSFEDVVLGGLAEDRGLYVPEELPAVSKEELTEVKTSVCVTVCLRGGGDRPKLHFVLQRTYHTSISIIPSTLPYWYFHHQMHFGFPRMYNSVQQQQLIQTAHVPVDTSLNLHGFTYRYVCSVLSTVLRRY